ncbi:unnamed protein product [Ilex paraguariensis]|uniref:Uncharacterized protein n=1 Tax=Ilex paraguariensis TaxID=185542 RepID=A0ABC8R5I6_9AQUA
MASSSPNNINGVGGVTGFGSGGGGGENHPCITRFVDRGSLESHRLYLARRTVLEMLRDRGYIVPDSEIDRSLSDFRSAFGDNPNLERLRICASLRSNPSKKGVYECVGFSYRKDFALFIDGKGYNELDSPILVIFCGTAEIRKAVIIGILSQIVNKESLHRVILVLQSKMNFHARKIVDEYSIKVETFQVSYFVLNQTSQFQFCYKVTDLLVNFTKHVLEPKHEILTAVEKQKLLKRYNVEDKQIPRMPQNDATARYYGLEKGQVVKVTYDGELTGSIVTYRCVM